jgi:hypothetical protein
LAGFLAQLRRAGTRFQLRLFLAVQFLVAQQLA